MPMMTIVVSLDVNIDDRGANVNEILQAVSQARDAFGVQLAQAAIEWQQEWMRARLCAKDRQAKKGLGAHPVKGAPPRRCPGRTFRKDGFRPAKRKLNTEIGLVEFPVGYVQCRQCGKKFAPILDVLRLRSHQRHSGELERVIVEATNKTSFRRAPVDVAGLIGVPTSKSSAHRWIAALDLPQLKPPRLRLLMADGTGCKKARGERGELRVAIGVTTDGAIMGLGTWSGRTWQQIGRDVKRRLGRGHRPELAVVDGEPGLDQHLATLARRTQRSRWHLVRNLRRLLWKDELKKAQTDPFETELAQILAVEIPQGEWEEVLPLEKHALRTRVQQAEDQFQEMIDEFEHRGYAHGAEYLQGARDRIFSRVHLWLDTGIVAPSSTGLLEEIMRELGRRVKKLGWNWKDHGLTQQATMILLRRYNQDEWNHYWRTLLDLQDRCLITITDLQCVA